MHPSPANGLPQSRGDCYGAGVRTITEDQLRSESTSGATVAEPKPVAAPRRFLARAVIAQAAITAPRIDAARFRADIDALADQSVDLP